MSLQPLEPFERDPAAIVVVPDTEAAEPPEAAWGGRPAAKSGRSGRLAAMAAGFGLTGLVLGDAARRIGGLIAESPLIGLPLAVFGLLFVVGTAALALREWRGLRQLLRRAGLRAAAARLVGSDFHGEAARLLSQIAEELPDLPDRRRPLAVYRALSRPTLADGEQLELFERHILRPLDRRAYRLVLEASRDIGVLTALSPAGLFAGVLVLWRTLLLLRTIASLYGMSPGPVASLALFRRALRNAVLAGVADVATHAALEHMGAGLAALLSARAGQGAGHAVLAARLGLEAIRLTRPLPFIAEKPPSLRQVTKSLFATREADHRP